ncbi:hypothetical protein P280DRAFT_550959 [Massarina eburnea CBS 473.64]|uniref:DUF7703 domain-containing protein n=1 Tax=Massarina eburnea CBS 473.64 TaxID=1395130 RepID=A0A6A6RU92_9PLEO|nr:hypothetical protein P280DRAFT_550959 [Massarina eburnea CBS 473.64]
MLLIHSFRTSALPDPHNPANMARDYGIGTNYKISFPTALLIMAFLSIATFNVLELTIVIFTTFRRWGGFYFYSLLVATWGVIPYVVGLFLKFYSIGSSKALYLVLISIGWPAMITGQSLVLYSRLHLISRGAPSTGRWVLIMIITNAIICHVPIIVLLVGANSPYPAPFLLPYSIYEKVQVTIFFIQEALISGIYVYHTSKVLRDGGDIRRNTRTVMTHLIWVNIFIIVLDISILAIEYAGLYDIQTTYKAAVYSIKLKMEFSILNRLTDMVQGRLQGSSSDQSAAGRRGSSLKMFKWKAFKSNDTTGKAKDDGPSSSASTLGHSAYAKMDDALPGRGMMDTGVMKTTQISIETSERVENDVELADMGIYAFANINTTTSEATLPDTHTDHESLHRNDIAQNSTILDDNSNQLYKPKQQNPKPKPTTSSLREKGIRFFDRPRNRPKTQDTKVLIDID